MQQSLADPRGTPVTHAPLFHAVFCVYVRLGGGGGCQVLIHKRKAFYNNMDVGVATESFILLVCRICADHLLGSLPCNTDASIACGQNNTIVPIVPLREILDPPLVTMG